MGEWEGTRREGKGKMMAEASGWGAWALTLMLWMVAALARRRR